MLIILHIHNNKHISVYLNAANINTHDLNIYLVINTL